MQLTSICVLHNCLKSLINGAFIDRDIEDLLQVLIELFSQLGQSDRVAQILGLWQISLFQLASLDLPCILGTQCIIKATEVLISALSLADVHAFFFGDDLKHYSIAVFGVDDHLLRDISSDDYALFGTLDAIL